MPPEDLTDSLLLRLHLRQLTSAGKARNTIRARESVIGLVSQHLDPTGLNPRALVHATAIDLVEWQGTLDGLAPASVSKYVMHTQHYYAWLVRPMRVIPESPASDLLRPVVKRGLPRPISDEQLAFALDACVDRMLFAWLVLGAYAGLRAFDIAALRTDDLLLSGATPFLRVKGKGGTEKLVAVGRRVVDAVASYTLGRGWMFTYEDGRHISAKVIDERINRYLARLGIPCTFHQLRHFFGTKTYELTEDLLYTQMQMRHADATSTQIYTLVDQAKHPEAIAALDAELGERLQMRERRRA